MNQQKRYRVKTRKLPSGEWVTLHIWARSKAAVMARFDSNYKGWSYVMPQAKHIRVDRMC